MVDLKHRYNWIDWAKTFGIFLVILGHIDYTPAPVKSWLYSFHMPLFFLLSGLLFKPRKTEDLIQHDLKRLLYPYVIYNVALFIIYSILHIADNSFSIVFLKKSLLAILLGMGYSTSWATPLCDSMWFIIGLFIIHVAVAIIGISNKQRIALFTIVSIVIICALNNSGIRTIIPLDSAIIATPFFLCGYYLKEIILKSDHNKISLLLISILSLLAFSVLQNYNGMVDIDMCLWGKSLLLTYFVATFGCLWTITTFKLLFDFNNKVTQIVSEGTIFIIGFNQLFISICKIIASKVGFLTPPIVESLIIGVVVLLISIACIIVLKNKYPQALGINNGK